MWQKIVSPKTKAATIAFQQKYKLEVDGIAGFAIWEEGARQIQEIAKLHFIVKHESIWNNSFIQFFEFVKRQPMEGMVIGMKRKLITLILAGIMVLQSPIGIVAEQEDVYLISTEKNEDIYVTDSTLPSEDTEVNNAEDELLIDLDEDNEDRFMPDDWEVEANLSDENFIVEESYETEADMEAAMDLFETESMLYGASEDIITDDDSPVKEENWDGNTYQLFNKSLTWTEAKEYCENLGGHLATITSSGEMSFIITDLLPENARNCYWIGLYQDTGTSPWKWVTGEEFSYSNWESGEPNNYQGNNELYVELFGKAFKNEGGITKTIGKWNDATNEGAEFAGPQFSLSNTGFICEFDGEDPVIVVSLGDSYSSGEGIEPFYGQDLPISKKVFNVDWLSHRSKYSWPSMLKLPGLEGRPLRTFKFDPSLTTESLKEKGCIWFFGAVSGAETKHFKKENQMKTVRQIEWDLRKEEMTLPLQLDIFDTIASRKYGTVDYVTLSVGGNDVGFVDIITNCVLESSYLGSRSLILRAKLALLRANIGTTMDNIREVYYDIHNKTSSSTRIIVAGYPKLLDVNGKGAFFSKIEADLVNSNVSFFNDKIESLVKDCTKDMHIYFVDIEEKFGTTHQAYSRENWLNGVIPVARVQDLDHKSVVSSYSLHPNYNGALAYAEAVNEEIDRIESHHG